MGELKASTGGHAKEISEQEIQRRTSRNKDIKE
jgi:hypothetical protein